MCEGLTRPAGPGTPLSTLPVQARQKVGCHEHCHTWNVSATTLTAEITVPSRGGLPLASRCPTLRISFESTRAPRLSGLSGGPCCRRYRPPSLSWRTVTASVSRIPSVKYLGLLAMSKILRTHPKSVQAHKDLVLQCLDDKDESIRLRALDLLYGMVRAPGWGGHDSTSPYPARPHQCSSSLGVQEEPDGDRQEADEPRGQGRGHGVPGRAADQDR